MKILLCLTTIIYTCSAGIQNGYGLNSVQEIEIEPQHLEHVQGLQFVDQGYHHNGASPGTPVEFRNGQSAGNGVGHGFGGHGGTQTEWQPLNDIHSHNSEPQIIKIIYEQGFNGHGRHSGNGFGGQSQPQIIKIIEEQSYTDNHGHNDASNQPHQILKIIEEQSYGGHGSNNFEPNFGGHGSPTQSEPQIIFADPPSIPLRPRPSTTSSSSNPLSSLGSIIPNILKLLFGGGNSQKSLSPLSNGGHRAINSPHAGRLTNAYGYGGTAKITRGGKQLNSFYKSGRVIESGTLKISSAKKGGKW